MQYDNRKKVIKLKWAALAELLISVAFFASALLAETCVAEYYQRVPESGRLQPLFSQSVLNLDYSWRLFFVLLGVVFLALSHFEVRLLTPDGRRFLGYKAYIIFFYKLLFVPASLGLGVLTSLNVSAEYYVYILMQFILILPYYALLFFFCAGYRDYGDGVVYYSALQTVHEWWKEGKLPGRPPKVKKERPPKPSEREKGGAESALPRRKIGGKAGKDKTPKETPSAPSADTAAADTAGSAPATPSEAAADTADSAPSASPETSETPVPAEPTAAPELAAPAETPELAAPTEPTGAPDPEETAKSVETEETAEPKGTAKSD